MSKESVKIVGAYQQGVKDKQLKVYKNPYNKNKDRVKYIAYKNGFKDN